MHPITKPLALLWCLWQRPAGATVLCRVGRWDRDHPHASAFRLAVRESEELTPADIVRRLRQPRARDTLNIQGFVRDHAVLAGELASDLVMKVASLVGDMQMLLGQQLDRLLCFAVVAWRRNLTP